MLKSYRINWCRAIRAIKLLIINKSLIFKENKDNKKLLNSNIKIKVFYSFYKIKSVDLIDL